MIKEIHGHLMNKLRFLLTISISIIATGCATVDISSSVDNRFVSNLPYQSILFQSNETNTSNSKLQEKIFCETAQKRGIYCHEFSQAFPILENITPEEFAQYIYENNIQALITIANKQSYSTSHYVPQTTYSSTSQVQSTGYNSARVTTQYNNYGGYTVSKPRRNYTIDMIDTLTWKTILKGHINSYGGGYTSHSQLVKKVPKEAMKHLSDKQLVPPLKTR